MNFQHSSFMRWTSRIMIVVMMSVGIPGSAFAQMVDTDQVVNHAQADQGRAKILALLERDDLRTQLQSYGVSADQAVARVNSLTDEEVLQVSGKLDQMAAGGDILGVAVLIFVILLITDILGLTRVFKFTRPITR